MSAEAWRRTGTDLAPLHLFVAGVGLSGPRARFAWQAWHFRCLHRCPRKLGDELAPLHLFVAGVGLSRHFRYRHRCPRKLGDELGLIWRRCINFSWQAWGFRYLRLDLRGRRDAFGTSIDVRGSLAPLHLFVAGVALSAPKARFACRA